MKYSILSSAVLLATLSSPAIAMPVFDEASLQAAIANANTDSSVNKIVFARNANINLSAPVIYTGSQDLMVFGRGAVVDGSAAGSFVLDNDLTAVTEDGTLVFNTAGNLTIKNLNVVNSATRGIVVNIPETAEGDDISVSLNKVSITGSALYGLHVDDNADEFDDGTSGSAIGVDLRIIGSTFTGNGTGAIDFDGVRVDERGEGDINSFIMATTIDGNGGDGIELDEAGAGDVDATMVKVSIDNNGFYNPADLDDGFDIDEADDGDINVKLIKVTANNNMDEGLDFDEAGEGDVVAKIMSVVASGNTDEGIKIDEEDAGNVMAKLVKVTASDNGDDSVQVTELGEGKIKAKLIKVKAENNAKYGIKMEQWVVEDEPVSVEEAGYLKAGNVVLNGNGKGDEIKVNNITIK